MALRDAYLSFADKVIFEGLDIGVAAGERACLVGRNGGGKSTLMRCLAGQIDLDKGTISNNRAPRSFTCRRSRCIPPV